MRDQNSTCEAKRLEVSQLAATWPGGVHGEAKGSGQANFSPFDFRGEALLRIFGLQSSIGHRLM
jgi:hypothetical protein